LLDPQSTSILLTDPSGEKATPRVEQVTVETAGVVRTTVQFRGVFGQKGRCRYVLRLSFFARTALVRLDFTLHNPHRARHRNGLWDLGDPGSILFRELALELALAGSAEPRVTWAAEVGDQPRSAARGQLEIYQDSSGGENWRSQNHVNRDGRVPCTFRGYRVRAEAKEHFGLRASPVVTVQGPNGGVTAAVPEFWQQFPKALEVEDRLLRVGLFPKQFGDLHELQGGEQKTHTVWLDFHPAGWPAGPSVEWVHQPALFRAEPQWYEASATIPFLVPTPQRSEDRLESFLTGVVCGDNSFFARREAIDEYGWRNYGEVYADHEQLYYRGPRPVVSHYNNQYDAIYGMLLQYLRTGEARWFELLDPLARHVMDVDIYHTKRDKAAYCGGLFWHTDHYRDAATCTHRAFSRWNCPAGGGPYGGGPSAEHNYTTGLLHYYYLTGDPRAREAVTDLADWVINCDDGSKNVFGLLDDSPTGTASSTCDYHGPGRGCGNSVNALLDGWALTGQSRYREKAESLIRRSVHPCADVAALDLLNTEARWSYTVFLSALSRYLRLKGEAGEIDFMYAYAQGSLGLFARWMLANEVPYFDHPEKLEFPTEAWAAQELRKANVLRLAAEHVDEPLRGQFLRRGNELAERAWSDLFRFETRSVARAAIILMTEGPRDAYLRLGAVDAAPGPTSHYDFGLPEPFTPQRARIRAQVRSLGGLTRGVARLANVTRWWKFFLRARG
jgi:hypothetical protein